MLKSRVTVAAAARPASQLAAARMDNERTMVEFTDGEERERWESDKMPLSYLFRLDKEVGV